MTLQFIYHHTLPICMNIISIDEPYRFISNVLRDHNMESECHVSCDNDKFE